MGCKQTKVIPFKQTSAEEALRGKINCPHELFYAKSQVTRPTPRLSGVEILQQLRGEGLVPDRQSSGGVAFSVPAVDGVGPRGKAPRRLEQIPVRCFNKAERRRRKADLFRLDRLVEQVQRNKLDREIKHKAVKDEKKRRQFLKKMRAEHQLQMREEKLEKTEGSASLVTMEPDPDEQIHPGLESLDWGNDSKGTTPSIRHNKLFEQARKMVPGEKQCIMFCGGRKCKYCSYSYWTKEQMDIDGIYSNWVTDKILAMARPTNMAIKEKKLLDAFENAGIKTVINLQVPGEHASCGEGLDKSGFSYDPQQLMEKGIFFYNFGWTDHGVAPMSTLLDAAKVMQFSLSEGKIAVHCHAGHGRTGLMIACYLVFNNRELSSDAVQYVRSRRPKAIQNGSQVRTVAEFEQYLKPFRIIFASKDPDAHDFSLGQFLNRQQHILHGFEAKKLKYIPKIVYVCCERLLELASKGNSLNKTRSTLSTSDLQSDILDRREATIEAKDTTCVSSRVMDSGSSKRCTSTSPQRSCPEDPSLWIVEALIETDYSDIVLKKVADFEEALNQTDEAWSVIAQEQDPVVLSLLMWEWLDQLSEPALSAQDLLALLGGDEPPLDALFKVTKGVKFLLEYVSRVIIKLQPISSSLHQSLLERLLSHLTHQSVRQEVLSRHGPESMDDWPKMRPNTTAELIHFVEKLIKSMKVKDSKKR